MDLKKKLLYLNYFLKFIFLTGSLYSLPPGTTSASANSDQVETVVEEKSTRNAFYTLRLGVGGFADSRSPSGKLLGGQFIFDAKPFKYPFAISASIIEFYSSSSDPSHSYQIQNMGTFNIFYIIHPESIQNLKIFCGGGIGGLQVPKDEPKNDDDDAVGLFYDLEAGLNYRVYKKVGVYGTVKYLYANKKQDGIRLIDFNELIYVAGVSFNFGF